MFVKELFRRFVVGPCLLGFQDLPRGVRAFESRALGESENVSVHGDGASVQSWQGKL